MEGGGSREGNTDDRLGLGREVFRSQGTHQDLGLHWFQRGPTPGHHLLE